MSMRQFQTQQKIKPKEFICIQNGLEFLIWIYEIYTARSEKIQSDKTTYVYLLLELSILFNEVSLHLSIQ